MQQMKAKVDFDLAALNLASLAARDCFACAKNPSGSAWQYAEYLTTPSGNVVATKDYAYIIASATRLRSDLYSLVRAWKRIERDEFQSEVLFWFGGVAGCLFMLWAWLAMFVSDFALDSIFYFIFMGSMFAIYFRQRMAQRHERLDFIEKKWREHDIAGMLAALRSGDKRWTYQPDFFVDSIESPSNFNLPPLPQGPRFSRPPPIKKRMDKDTV